MVKELKKINVAPSSDEGHYVTGKNVRVINLDDVTESFYVQGESQLVTKNHTNLKMKDNCLITCQVAFNPLAKIYEKVVD